MSLSGFDLFKIGSGPSSSHTVGPMLAALRFAEGLRRDELLGTVDTTRVDSRLAAIRTGGKLNLLSEKSLHFNEKQPLALLRKPLTFHPNGMIFRAFDAAGLQIRSREYSSVGGGFVVDEQAAGADRIAEGSPSRQYPFSTAKQLLAHCSEHNLTIRQVILANAAAWRPDAETRSGLLHSRPLMQDCVEAGCRNAAIVPGGLKVKRRAATLHCQLCKHAEASLHGALSVLDRFNLYALAVNEENASGARVVTAPTYGAAGIAPAVLHSFSCFIPSANDDGIVRVVLTAAAIGILHTKNASISGAKVVCQDKGGVACSMAAGALCDGLGGNVNQLQNAAEISTEHNLGLTCDPIGGLAQVPCIEPDAMGCQGDQDGAHGLAWRWPALRLARQGDPHHAPDRCRHEQHVQGNRPRWPGSQYCRMLSTAAHITCSRVGTPSSCSRCF
jgi:L-serine dehydratase